ncbi:MAG: hypothetical protein U0414_10480 [Polyangiaceae bacterium]
MDAPFVQSIAVYGGKIWVGGYAAGETVIGGQALKTNQPFLVQLDLDGHVAHVDALGNEMGMGFPPPEVKIVTRRGMPALPERGYVAVSTPGKLSVFGLENLGPAVVECSIGNPMERLSPAIAIDGGFAVLAVTAPSNEVQCGAPKTGNMMVASPAGELGLFTFLADDNDTFLHATSPLSPPARDLQLAFPNSVTSEAGIADVSGITATMPGKVAHYKFLKQPGSPGWVPTTAKPWPDDPILLVDDRLARERIAGGGGTFMTGLRSTAALFISPLDDGMKNFVDMAAAAKGTFRDLALTPMGLVLVGGAIENVISIGGSAVTCPSGAGCAGLFLMKNNGTPVDFQVFPGKGVVSAVTMADGVGASAPTQTYVAGTFVGALDIHGNKLKSDQENLFVAALVLHGLNGQ